MTANGDITLSAITEGTTKPETTNEKAKLVEPPQLSAAQAEKLRKGALIVAWLTIGVLLILAIVSFVVGARENSAASFAFAIEAILDCLTSAVVVWRYIGNAYTVFSDSRERTACIVLGVLFILSSFAISVKSIVSLALVMPPSKSSIIWNIALVNAIACTALAIAKFILGKKLNSKSLITDALSSSIGALISYSILVSDLIYTQHSKVWWVDSAIGIVCSIFLFIYGIKLLYDQDICKSRRDAMDSSNNNTS